MDFKKKVPPTLVLEVLGAVALLLWRTWVTAGVGLWRDWLAWLALAWILDLTVAPPRARTWLALGAAAALLIVYAAGQGRNLSFLAGGPS
jgi:hypothetical protein